MPGTIDRVTCQTSSHACAGTTHTAALLAQLVAQAREQFDEVALPLLLWSQSGALAAVRHTVQHLATAMPPAHSPAASISALADASRKHAMRAILSLQSYDWLLHTLASQAQRSALSVSGPASFAALGRWAASAHSALACAGLHAAAAPHATALAALAHAAANAGNADGECRALHTRAAAQALLQRGAACALASLCSVPLPARHVPTPHMHGALTVSSTTPASATAQLLGEADVPCMRTLPDAAAAAAAASTPLLAAALGHPDKGSSCAQLLNPDTDRIAYNLQCLHTASAPPRAVTAPPSGQPSPRAEQHTTQSGTDATGAGPQAHGATSGTTSGISGAGRMGSNLPNLDGTGAGLLRQAAARILVEVDEKDAQGVASCSAHAMLGDDELCIAVATKKQGVLLCSTHASDGRPHWVPDTQFRSVLQQVWRSGLAVDCSLVGFFLYISSQQCFKFVCAEFATTYMDS